MDLADPTQAITPTLDGPVLAVLARSGRPMTAGEIAQSSVRGSEIGIRRCLARLVSQGIVKAMEMGRNRVHELNADHIAAPAAIALADLRNVLIKRLQSELQGWSPQPVYSYIFGSAARREGGPDSDIDILLVHPPFPGDQRPSAVGSLVASIAQAMTLSLIATPRDVDRWTSQIDRLRGLVQSWTGNQLQLIDYSVVEWQRSDGIRLGQEIRRDGIELFSSLKAIGQVAKA